MIRTQKRFTSLRDIRIITSSAVMAVFVAWHPPAQAEFVSAGTVQVTSQSALLTDPANLNGGFDIAVNFLGGLTPSQETIFNQTEALWEARITGYQAGISITGVSIAAEGKFIDGVGGILGSAGPTQGVTQGGFVLATNGIMSFDSADLAAMENNGSLGDVVAHEMAHVLGFGTLWDNNNVYTSGTGQFTGANALGAWRAEFDQPGATFVPVELGGGSGTANGHWDEVNGGAGLTGITDSQGRDMRNELMTGWLNAPTFVSNTTLQSFADIGFALSSVPEPSTLIMLVSGGLGFILLRSRRRRSCH